MVIEDPAGVPLYHTRVKDRFIAEVDEHNLPQMIDYLKYKSGVVDAEELLTNLLAENKEKQEYLAKVRKAAEQYNVVVDGRPTEEVVAEIKAKAEEAKSKLIK